MTLDDVEIIRGDETKDHLQAGELEKLVSLWMDEIYAPVKVPISKTREAVENTLSNKSQEEQKEQERLYLTEHLQKAIDRGDMVIARKNGKTIGMVRVCKLYKVAVNYAMHGDIYEIGKALVVPEERGKGIYRKLRQQAIAHLREEYGDVPILTGTKNEGIKKLNREDGWTEIGFEEYMRIHGSDDERIESKKNNIIEKGWTAFLYIPQKKK